MYSSFSIENFRLFDCLRVEALSRVNLIAGPNNVGKTALLEALWMLSRPSASLDAPRDIRRRGVGGREQGELFSSLFFNYDTTSAISLKADNQSGRGSVWLAITGQARMERPLFDWSNVSEGDLEDGSIEMLDFDSQLVFQHTNESGHIYRMTAWLEAETKSGAPQTVVRQDTLPDATSNRSCEFESPGKRHSARRLAALFGRAQMGHYVPKIEKAIRLLEPRLQRLEVITDSRGIPEIHADIGAGRPFPISIMGEGTKRLLALTLSFTRAQNGAVLIDEIENGLHHSVLVDVWKNLDWLSREFNVQVFATTHSYECIRAANDAFSEMESEDLHFHRLNRKRDQVRAVTYTKAMLDSNIEYLWELR